MQGTPVMGVVLSVGKLEPAMIPALAIFLTAGFFLVAHIWTLNDWSDFREDRGVENKISAKARTTTRSVLLRFSIWSLIAGLALFCFLPLQTLTIAGIIASLGLIYSLPGIRAKGIPLLSSVTHLVGGALHFLLGYSLFGGIDQRAILISIFFSLIFTAGHATQEVQDFDADRSAGTRTNAVVFGKTPAFLAAIAGFAIAFLYLVWLAFEGIVPARLGFSALLLPVQAACTLHVLHLGLERKNLEWLRLRYRVIFGLVGINILSLAF
jgi:4-hydroxybenzoate polyprenyltransferase